MYSNNFAKQCKGTFSAAMTNFPAVQSEADPVAKLFVSKRT